MLTMLLQCVDLAPKQCSRNKTIIQVDNLEFILIFTLAAFWFSNYPLIQTPPIQPHMYFE